MDHERIWLQNVKDADPSIGQLWCKDKVWPDDPEDGEPTEYIRADIVAAIEQDLNTMMTSRLEQEGIYKAKIERLEAALRDVEASLPRRHGWSRLLSVVRAALTNKEPT